jgi:hypothetical protein
MEPGRVPVGTAGPKIGVRAPFVELIAYRDIVSDFPFTTNA